MLPPVGTPQTKASAILSSYLPSWIHWSWRDGKLSWSWFLDRILAELSEVAWRCHCELWDPWTWGKRKEGRGDNESGWCDDKCCQYVFILREYWRLNYKLCWVIVVASQTCDYGLRWNGQFSAPLPVRETLTRERADSAPDEAASDPSAKTGRDHCGSSGELIIQVIIFFNFFLIFFGIFFLTLKCLVWFQFFWNSLIKLGFLNLFVLIKFRFFWSLSLVLRSLVSSFFYHFFKVFMLISIVFS